MKRIALTILIGVLLAGCTTPRARAANTYYCDLSLSSDGAGTSGDPWQWSQAVNAANVTAGDAVYVRGTTTNALELTAANAKGSAVADIAYEAWAGQSTPSCRRIGLTGPADFYLTFSHFQVNCVNNNPSGRSSDGIHVAACHHATFAHCVVNGVWTDPVDVGMTDSCVHVVGSPTAAGNITFSYCVIYEGLYLFACDGTIDGPIQLLHSDLHTGASAAIQWVVSNNPANLLVQDTLIYEQIEEYFHYPHVAGDNTHASAFSLWNDNVTVSRCVVHSYGNTALYCTYPDHVAEGNPPGYADMTIEDSLFYDSVQNTAATVQMYYITDNIQIHGNTIVSHFWTYPDMPWKAQKYRTALMLYYYAGHGYTGSEIHMRNNVIVGTLDSPSRIIDEDYNLIWSWFGVTDGHYTYWQNPLGAHSKIVAYATEGQAYAGHFNTPFTDDLFGTSGEFFVGSALFDTYHAQYTQYVSPYYHGKDLTLAYRPVVGNTLVIDAGVSGYGSGYDVAGNARGASYDIGAYEYVAGEPPPGTPTNPVPHNATTGVALSVTLHWDPSSATNDYTVYWGTSTETWSSYGPTTGLTFKPSDYESVSLNTWYYWKVVANGDGDQHTSSSTWSYKTTPTANYHFLMRHN
jgi:hypothetical protein